MLLKIQFSSIKAYVLVYFIYISWDFEVYCLLQLVKSLKSTAGIMLELRCVNLPVFYRISLYKFLNELIRSKRKLWTSRFNFPLWFFPLSRFLFRLSDHFKREYTVITAFLAKWVLHIAHRNYLDLCLWS